jgi:hypothetical protein
MKAKEFLNGKTLTAVETVNNLIINLVIEETLYGLKIAGVWKQATPYVKTGGNWK